MEQQVAAQERAAAQQHANAHGAEQAVAHDAVQVIIPAGTHVLAGKGHSGLCKGVHGGVDKALDVGGCRVARHDRGAKRVDRRLDDHVGEAEHRALQAGWQADEQNLGQGPLVEAQLVQVEVEGALLFQEQGRDHAGGNRLADDGRQRDAGHAHLEPNDEDQIQDDIDDACRRQTEQRPFGVAHGPQQCRAEVVQHGHGHPEKVNFQVEGGQVNDILRAGHQLQQAPGHKKAHARQQHTADKAQRHRRVDSILHALIVPRAKAAGSHNVGTQREAHKQVDQQVDEGTVGAHRRQSGAARKAAHRHNVCCVEQQLQNAGRRQRERKQDDFLQHRAAGQIARTGNLRHGKSASFEQAFSCISYTLYC